MLFVYGPYLPIRVLEEIRFWKQQEKEHVDVIKAIVPSLEPVYVKLLDDWAKVFGDTESAADSLLQYALAAPQKSQPNEELVKQTERLLAAAFRQSQEWIRQLDAILQQSQAVQSVPLAKVVLLHIIRESEYFLAVLETLNQPGLISQAASQVPPAVDPYHLQPNPRNDFYSRKLDQQLTHEAQEQASAEAAVTPGQRVKDGAVPIGGHRLPPLPYPYNALEPHIDEATVRIHHDKHHLTYVEDLNKAEKKLEEARTTGNFDLVKHWERELAFNGAGHYLHTIYWDTMNPKGGGRPSGALAEQINRDFGSFEAFHAQFSKAAEKVEGGGWAILVWSPRARRLEILQAEKHQNLSQWDVVPLLPIDVWEHSYYLKHQNKRADYIKDWWNVVYWPAVLERFKHARQLQWQPY
ncbi:superoxide dismutase [Paenibacillus yonginensis]|uniref:superoxide dismutase n=1 Tax=Paenibacillus yonginensis TaxID=1462996 RepID=A0A1B1N679_9BACL|nr:Fe-Mn family superoxide dismutase [Paenibacillus yonginensis]ANS76929.1 superoxide dismutase [Paenibacillus yonginensis]